MNSYLQQLLDLKEDKGFISWGQQLHDGTNPSIKKDYWKDRIVSELEYLNQISILHKNNYKERIEYTAKCIIKNYKEEGNITKNIVQKAEDQLIDLKAEAKKYNLLCVGHAHLDMNWLWGYHETVDICVETIKTMLQIMREYPDFTFSQSQASVYEIIEKYANELIPEIKQRIHEGRWELAASTWVEGDKNIPNGESLIRQILYTKKYLSELFDVDVDSLQLDFEPDTFGHNANMPELLSQGGVKYYYHCRGYNKENIYRWMAPSGNEVIVYREPFWYLKAIGTDVVKYIPSFCNKHGLKTVLNIYGVGDHGGGPTRRDIEKILDMREWPLFPNVKFGTYKEFYDELESIKNSLPVVKAELNCIFTGCYTSQSRIKMANKYSEAAMYETECANAISAVNNKTIYPNEIFEKCWRKLLFNQFHDIIPGSCITFTREYALGLFQQIVASSNQTKKKAISSIINNIDTSRWSDKEQKDQTAYGAGVGYSTNNFDISQVSRTSGKTRVFHVFNSLPYDRNENIELVLWDYEGDKKKIKVEDINGQSLNYILIDSGTSPFFGHWFAKILVNVSVASLGYQTLAVYEDESYPNELAEATNIMNDPRIERPMEYTMENEYIKAKFNPTTMWMTSLIDKKTNKEYIDKTKGGAGFKYIIEDASQRGDAWVIGKYLQDKLIDSNVSASHTAFFTGVCNNSLRQSLSYSIKIGEGSEIKTTIILDKNSKSLKFENEVKWSEIGKQGEIIPQLNFYVPINGNCDDYIYDIPMSTIRRKEVNQDVPASSFVLANIEDDNNGVMLSTDCKHGFRAVNNCMSVTLIRSSTAPDQFPENDIHKFCFCLGINETTANNKAIKEAFKLVHPLTIVPGKVQKGDLLGEYSYLKQLDNNIMVSAIKMSEKDRNKMIIRLYETEGIDKKVDLIFNKTIKEAKEVDALERPINSSITFKDNVVTFSTKRYAVINLSLQFK